MMEQINQLIQGQRALAAQLQNLEAENTRLRQEHREGLSNLPDLVQALHTLVENKRHRLQESWTIAGSGKLQDTEDMITSFGSGAANAKPSWFRYT